MLSLQKKICPWHATKEKTEGKVTELLMHLHMAHTPSTPIRGQYYEFRQSGEHGIGDIVQDYGSGFIPTYSFLELMGCLILQMRKCRALEVGAGYGYNSILLRRLGCDVIATDLLQTQVTAIKTLAQTALTPGELENFKALQWNVLNHKVIPFERNTRFNFILSDKVLHFFSPSQVQTFFKRMYGLLNENGILLITVQGIEDKGPITTQFLNSGSGFMTCETDLKLWEVRRCFSPPKELKKGGSALASSTRFLSTRHYFNMDMINSYVQDKFEIVEAGMFSVISSSNALLTVVLRKK